MARSLVFFTNVTYKPLKHRLKKSDEVEGRKAPLLRVPRQAAREDARRGNSLIYLLIYPSESTSCTWCSVRCDGSRKSIFTEILSSSLPRDTLSQDGEKRFLPLSYPFLRRETLRLVSERPDTKPIRPSAYTMCT